MKSIINELFEFDNDFKCNVIGTDEAGRGSGIGAVFAAAVHFNNINCDLIEKLSDLNDSKKLSPKKRDYLYEIIKNETINSIISIDAEVIERDNILQASLSAMRQAVKSIAEKINRENLIVLVDGNNLISRLEYPQKYVIKGDSNSASIAAASILAKVERDRYVKELSKKYPQYCWDKNMGYLTKEHLDAIDKYGLTPLHRKSFLQKHFAKQISLF